jgi:hypothetical protein
MAQTANNVPYPGGPVLAKTADFAKWTTTTLTSVPKSSTGDTTAPASSEKADLKKTIVTTTKTLPVRLVSIIAANGEDQSIWCLEPFQVLTSQHFPKPFILTSPSPTYVDYSRSDFPELEWISEANFVGIQKVGEKQVLLFRTTIAPNAAAAAAAKAAGHEISGSLCEATVDAKTRLPVSFKQDGMVSTYDFEDPPTSVLVPPPEVKALLTEEKARLQRLSRVPPAG